MIKRLAMSLGFVAFLSGLTSSAGAQSTIYAPLCRQLRRCRTGAPGHSCSMVK
jgi:hypothetical protein